ncbi:hypothetical protein F8M41_009282 [Gigaspora margarita]|uniref:Uncharacterized protein n=1 Tax=Gigaspora margarita TaxID=4874 RepID=A0A8H4B466_GIGMA|nr:hypothetical protein F8M41_009282 [Gigaspora margarita]
MSNEESLLAVFNNQIEECTAEKNDLLNKDVFRNQVSNPLQQARFSLHDNKLQDFLNKTIEELCKIYNELKTNNQNDSFLIFNETYNFLEQKQQTLEDIINPCIDLDTFKYSFGFVSS